MPNLYSYYTQVIFLCFIIINHLVEIYLLRRQLKIYQKHQMLPPEEFKDFLTPTDHQKAIQYSRAKLKVSQLHLIYDCAIMLFWFPFRGAEKLYLALPLEGIHHEVLFLMSISAIGFLLNLPWSVYSTFVLEARFGFNKSTPKLYVTDRLKGMILGGIIGIPLLYALIYLFNTLGDYWWIAAFVLLTLFQLSLVWIYPTLIAPLFNKFHPLEEEGLKHGIEGLLKNAGMKASGIFVMDASRRSAHGNAYFTGLGKSKRVVFFDTLLKQLVTPEILAILAHELGHMKLKHIPKSMITSIVLSFVGFWLMAKLAHAEWFFSGHFFRVSSPGILLFLFTQAIGVYTFWFTPVGSWVSRKREFEADAYAASVTDPDHLVQGLLKLYQHNASPVVTDKIYSGFYHSHPPALERIRKLESLPKPLLES